MTRSASRILLTRLWPAEVERKLIEAFTVERNHSDQPMTAAAIQQGLAEFDVICPTVSDSITAPILHGGAHRTKLLANYGAGVDHIDLNAAQAAGIAVTNTPDVLTEATAELAILLMMMAARRTTEGERELREGRWTGWRPTHMVGQSLHGKQLGLIGFGRIGQATARLARAAWGMTIAYHAPRRAPLSVEAEFGAQYHASLETLAAASDVVSLHCRAGPETRHLIDEPFLARMQSHAILVNTARGSMVDEEALASALARGIIGGAGLDVFESEPAVHHSLLAAPNATLLPHLGSATRTARIAMGMQVARNIAEFLAGREPPNRVI